VGSHPFLPGADADYQEAFDWYFKRSPRAADGFEAAVEQALREIVEAPTRWPLLDERHRFHLLKTYPYYLVYRIDEEQVVVVAVAHGRRHPEYWKGRD
jgi:plasmid stabilization system protein ParE